MNKRLKLIAILAILVILIISIARCSTKEETVSIDDFINKLETSNYIIGNKIEKNAVSIGAEQGYSIKVGDEYIEVYSYSSSNKEKIAKSNMKSAKKKGEIDYMGDKVKAEYNKGLVLVNYENHPDKDKILEVFESL